ncbi:acetylcholinesterase-1-like [Ixodes scapularis]|uniref:acetylcholinesterase-1-like n=1 Tax=Ixodes scapularis TaxID=6945 RepID=UPI001A9D6D79|nr:acetylcholinesterase-1-like [Ixodes scapularis]
MASMGDVVIVKMNYRLGAFGFLHAHNDDVPGNMGIHDMHLALLWVRRNIKSFGGDPSRITAFGSSAGAMSIGLMLTSPIASHLIQVAILQSGSPCVPMIARVNSSLQAADELAFRTGCATGNMSVHTHGRQVVGCLRRVNVRRILKVQDSMFKKLLLFLPIFGDDLLPVNILRAVERGLFPKDVTVMLGVTPDEGTTILTTLTPHFYKRESHRKVSKSELFSTCNRTFLHSFSKSALRKIYWNYLGLLGHTNYVTLRSAIANCIADYFMVCPTHVFAEGLSQKGVPVFFYQFDYRTKNSVDPPWMGVIHTAELYYLFGEPFATSWYTDKEREFSKTLVDIWVTFAKTGKPPARFHWPAYRWNARMYLRLSPDNFVSKRGPREEWCKLWEEHLY